MIALIDGGGNALLVQVLQEFYVQATRSTRPDALPHDIAAGLIRTWLRFKVQGHLRGDYDQRVGDQGSPPPVLLGLRHCCCRPRARLPELYTEDMTHGREIEGVLAPPPPERGRACPRASTRGSTRAAGRVVVTPHALNLPPTRCLRRRRPPYRPYRGGVSARPCQATSLKCLRARAA